MLELITNNLAESVSIGTVILGFALERIFRLKAKLFYSIRHASSYPVEEPLHDKDGKVIQKMQVVHTASIVAENTGLQPATDVEFTFNWKPPIFTVYPGRAFEASTTGMGRWSLTLPSLAPKEVFVIEIMSINQELPMLTAVRSREVEGKAIAMIPQRAVSPWLVRLEIMLSLIGIGTCMYFLASFIEAILG
ncbi:hypothetical protein [Altererythrobacter lutimaris]|uniref:Uncharacterized protein n=1 Tax=Altererythrobacter lutimaris TaxID=2743979 RepID=A0A850H6C1_9SPHN|nr:hypothetical protein [Altererythrobacter lutimaris]NVE93373.1 hypothetical protein [Altererythrobacter lutimaris]